MSIYDEVENLDVFDIDNLVDDTCEVCFMDEFGHQDSCPINENNKFIDEETIIAEEGGML